MYVLSAISSPPWKHCSTMAEPHPWRQALFLPLAVLYPLLVYFGLQLLGPRWLVLLLVIIGVRHMMSPLFPPTLRLLWALCLALLAAATLVTDSALGLLIYPVLMNAGLFLLFFGSWLAPPTIIEHMARIRDPDIPEPALRYIRKLTLVWCGFFIVNGSLSLYSLTLSREWWTLYNGLISYALMAALFCGELLFRKQVISR